MTIRVTGVTENKYLIVRQGRGKPEAHIKKDGVYTFKDNNLYFGFGVSVIGECNITITQLPTSILKDFSGNGNHAYLYGGKGKLNSGMGVYNNDFTDSGHGNFTWVYTTGDITVNGADSFTVHNNREKWVFRCTTNVKPMTVKIVGVSNDINFKYRYESENGEKWIFFKKDGIYELPATIGTWQGFNLEKNNDIDVNITVTQIPDYPDQLCYDGKMYAVAYDMPILTDYTVMAERTWFERQNRACFLSKITTSGTGAFGFEFYNEYNEDTTYSFGRVNNVEQFKDGITYQITNSYNGIVKLDYIVNGKDNAELYIGKLRPSERPAFIGCHGDILLFNRSLTEYEISWVKNNMMCSKQQEPDIDL